jgi:hypothetical protein
MAIFQGIKTKTILARQAAIRNGRTKAAMITEVNVATSPIFAHELRVVSSTMNLQKETYQSNEIRTDQQVADFRHGAKQATGTISCEISPKAQQFLLQDVVRRDYTAAFTSITSIAIASVAVASDGVATITGTSTTFLSSIKVGMVLAFTAGFSTGANLNNRFVVISVSSDTVFTCKSITGTPLEVKGTSTSGVTIAGIGGITYAPATGHTNFYYALEKLYVDSTTHSELYFDVRPTNAQVKVPSNGMATVDFPLIGLSMETGTSQQISNAATTSAFAANGIESGANGVIVVGGVVLGTITSIDFDINGNGTAADGVVGSVDRPDVFRGKIGVTGTFTAHFDTVGALALQNAFLNESTITIIVALAAENSTTTDFISFTMPKVKLGGADADFGEGGLKRTFPFTALKNETTGSGLEVTTIQIHDSKAAV